MGGPVGSDLCAVKRGPEQVHVTRRQHTSDREVNVCALDIAEERETEETWNPGPKYSR